MQGYFCGGPLDGLEISLPEMARQWEADRRIDSGMSMILDEMPSAPETITIERVLYIKKTAIFENTQYCFFVPQESEETFSIFDYLIKNTFKQR